MSIIFDIILCMFNSFTTIVYYTAVMPVKRKRKWGNEIGLTTALVLSSVVSYVLRYNSPVRFVCVLTVMSLTAILFFDAGILNKIRTVAESVIMSMIGEIFGGIVYQKFFGATLDAISYDSPDRAFMSLVVAAIIAAIVPIAILLRKRAKTGDLWSSALFQLGIVFSQVCMMCIAYLGSNDRSVFTVGALMVAEVPGIVISLFCTRTILAITGIRIAEKEKEFESTKADMEYDYYKLALENSEKLSVLRHDISNAIQTAMTLIHSGDITKGKRLLEDIDAENKSTAPVVSCDNAIINVILALKYEEMKKYDINFKAMVYSGLADIQVSDRELTSVLTNLLDNAKEACMKCESDREVFISFGKKQGFYIIKVENSYCPKDIYIPDSVANALTTKDNKEKHGLGMRSIYEISKKYDGNFSICKNGEKVTSIVTFAQKGK